MSIGLLKFGDMYFICHLTSQDQTIEVLRKFMGGSSLHYVTTLKILVAIGILLVKRKNASSKTWMSYTLTTTENWVDWISTRRVRERAWKLKNISFFHFMTTFYNFALKIETSIAKRVVKPISETRNFNDVIVYVWFIYSFSDKF